MSSSKMRLAMIALASGSAVIAIAGLVWWYKRKRPPKRINDLKPEDLSTVVGTVDKLWVYPMKSAYRVEVEEIECTSRGFKHDRCWVVADEEGRLLSQKRAPKLATIVQKVEENSEGSYTLVLSSTDHGELRIQQPDSSVPYTSLSLFTMTGMAQDVGDEAAQWVSKCIGVDGCRVYYMASTSEPRKPMGHPKYGDLCLPDDETSFSNFSPVFIASTASLEELNRHMKEEENETIPMTRFRPNIVVKGCTHPHEEDSWTMVGIGESCILKLINPGPRCAVTTVDQELGEPPANNEPLDTLNTYRRYEQVYGEHNPRYTTGPLFGANFSVISPGTIKSGDAVRVQ